MSRSAGSALSWLRAALIGLAAALLIVLAVSSNIANTALRNNPVLAATAAPYNGLAQDALVTSQLALQLQSQQQGVQAEAIAQAQAQGLITAEQVELIEAQLEKVGPIDMVAVARNARAALTREPFALISLVALASEAQSRGNQALAERLLTHASELSRRNAMVQLQLIQRSVDDPEELVRNVDATLRTNQSMFGTVFPLLGQALSDPQLVDLMRPIAREDPDWYKLFIGEALTIPSALPAVRTLMMAEPSGSAGRDPQLRRNLISQLVAANRVPLARSYFASLHRNVAGTIVDPTFVNPDYEPPFGWQLNDDPDLTGDFVNKEGLAVYAERDREGEVARQLVSLPAGRHAVQIEAQTSPGTQVTVNLTCRGRDRPLPVAASGRGRFSFNVPAGCADQWLGLSLRDHDDATTAEATIRRIRLV